MILLPCCNLSSAKKAESMNFVSLNNFFSVGPVPRASAPYQVDDFDPPSFSLGLDDTQLPSFSLGIDDVQPPTPGATDAERHQGAEDNVLVNGDDFEEMPTRTFKRLCRGPSAARNKIPRRGFSPDVHTPESTVASPAIQHNVMEASVPDQIVVDDIEEFSSEEEPSSTKSQRYSSRSFSVLKPFRTPPVFERKGSSQTVTPESSYISAGASHPTVSIKKTSLGSKEVKLQGVAFTRMSKDCNNKTASPCSFPAASFDFPSSSLRTERTRTPVYEFRDNQICIDVDDDEIPDMAGRCMDNHIGSLLHERFPHFSFVDDLEQGASGEPVYIDYRGQFGSKKNTAGNFTASVSVEKLTSQAKDKNKRRKKVANVRKRTNGGSQVSQENVSSGTTGKKGYWLTESGGKVYVTTEGQRLSGRNAYKRYLKDNGKLTRRPQKQKAKKRK